MPSSRSDRLDIAEFTVDFRSREVWRNGNKIAGRVAVKPLQVLHVLAQHAGQVVSRERLLEEVWRGTLPTDDVLTQAVKSLRRVLRDDAANPRLIETIAKSGYRLIAPVTRRSGAVADESAYVADAPSARVEEIESAADEGADDRTSRSFRDALSPSRVAVLFGAVLVAVIIVSVGALWRWRQPAEPQRSDRTPRSSAEREPPVVVRLASSAQWEWQPRLAPDEGLVAYVMNREEGSRSIYVQSLLPDAARALTHPSTGDDDTQPVWSPDGASLAFQRTGQNGCAIMIVSAAGGEPRRLADCHREDAALDWSPDGRFLIAGGPLSERTANGLALARLPVPGGEWEHFEYERRDSDVDFMPRYSPDGRWIAFRRGSSGGDLWRVPAQGGKPERLTFRESEFRGFDWLPDGRGFVMSTFGFDAAGAQLIRFDLGSREFRSLAVSAEAARLDIGRSGRLVFENTDIDAHIVSWRLGASSVAEVLSSGRGQLLPSFSPDGRTAAFISDRSGRNALWLGEPQGDAPPRLLAGLTPETRFPVEWSSDGRRLLAVGLSEQGRGIHEIDVASGRLRLLPFSRDAQRHAMYIPGSSDYLVLTVDQQNRSRLTRLRPARGGYDSIASLEDVSYARFDARGDRVIFTRAGATGLWAATPNLTHVEALSTSQPDLENYRFWAIGANDIWIGKVGLRGERTTLGRLGGNESFVAPGEAPYFPLLAEHRGLFLLSAFTRQGVDIAMIELAAASP